MKVTYNKSYEFELGSDDMKRAATRVLTELVYPGQYLKTIKGEIWLAQDDPDWRHGSVSEEPIRKATELDLAVFTVLHAIK